MSNTVIRVGNLSKRYVLNHQRSGDGLRHVMQEKLAAPFAWVKAKSHTLGTKKQERETKGDELGGKNTSPSSADFWALRDVSFEVKRGDVVGIIGRNGAGKSTLLKILSRITEPTSGRIEIDGRVASLLEVGTGFHPELTGRENIFLNGAILGMKRSEIRQKFDEIVDFAEVEQFLDTPVKRYSSGMYVRLAFAVAAHLEPEILIVDEVLAVGDMQFQKKCLGKMQDVANRQGRTVLFVSHNMIPVQSLCRRALLLSEGRILEDGSSATIIASYLRRAHRGADRSEWSAPGEAPGIQALRIKRVRIVSDSAPEEGLLTMQTPLRVTTEFWVMQGGLHLHLTYHLLNDQGIVVLTTACRAARRREGLYRLSFGIPASLLNSGVYSFKLLIVRDENNVVGTFENIASFTVHDTQERTHAFTGREPGVVQPVLAWDER